MYVCVCICVKEDMVSARVAPTRDSSDMTYVCVCIYIFVCVYVYVCLRYILCI